MTISYLIFVGFLSAFFAILPINCWRAYKKMTKKIKIIDFNSFSYYSITIAIIGTLFCVFMLCVATIPILVRNELNESMLYLFFIVYPIIFLPFFCYFLIKNYNLYKNIVREKENNK